MFAQQVQLLREDYKWEKAENKTTSTCNYCPIGCTIDLETNSREKLVRIGSNLEGPANKGQTCFKGKFGFDFVNSKSKIKYAMERTNKSLAKSNLSHVMTSVSELIKKTDHKNYAMIIDSTLSNEDMYLAAKFASEVVGTNNVISNADIDSNLRYKLTEMLGYSSATNSINDLKNSKSYLVVSANVTENHNILSLPIKQSIDSGQSQMVVIDQRETELTKFASLWLNPYPGSETYLIGGIIRAIIDQSLEDKNFVEKNCNNFSEFRKSIWKFDLIKVSSITGISVDDINQAAKILTDGSMATIYSNETIKSENIDELVKSLIDLSLLTGNIGCSGGGLYPLYKGSNSQGATDLGLTSVVDNPSSLDRIDNRAISFSKILDLINNNKIEVLHLVGDFIESYNDKLFEIINSSQNKIKVISHKSMINNNRNEVSDFILPSTTFAESEGTKTNIERRIQLSKIAIKPKNDQTQVWKSIQRLSNHFDSKSFKYDKVEKVFDDISKNVKLYKKFNYKYIAKNKNITWPLNESNVNNVLYSNQKNANDQKFDLTISDLKDSIDKNNTYLAQGRVLNKSKFNISLREKDESDRQRVYSLSLHPDDAVKHKLKQNQKIKLVSKNQTPIECIVKTNGKTQNVFNITTLFGHMIQSLDESKSDLKYFTVPDLQIVPVEIEK